VRPGHGGFPCMGRPQSLDCWREGGCCR
jgi:hypothetical protein